MACTARGGPIRRRSTPTAALVVTPFGLVPAGLLQQLGRGPDLVAVAGLPLLAGYALLAVALVAAAAVVLAVLS